jgi:hypothetical protein
MPKDAKEHQKEIGTFCQRSMEKKGLDYLHFEFWLQNIEPLTNGVVLRYFPPFPLFSASQFRVWILLPRPASALFPRVNSADSLRGGEGSGLGRPPAGISPNKEIRFFNDFSILT